MSLCCSIDFYLINWVSAIVALSQYSNSPATGWVSDAGQLVLWRTDRSASQERFYDTQHRSKSTGGSQTTISPSGLLGLPAALSVVLLWHNVDQNPHVPSARMDLPGSHLQELQPDLRRVDNQTEDMLALEQSCEYKVRFQKMLFVSWSQWLNGDYHCQNVCNTFW